MKVIVKYQNGSCHSEIVTDSFFRTHIDRETGKPITVPAKARNIAYTNGLNPHKIMVIKDDIAIFNEIIKENSSYQPLNKPFKVYKSLHELTELA